ncbi:hypothetical protein FRACYDRAFT_231937 [Fragilariopsis cylindrus CCMP1102]|uniref:Uncharacterized protein n=1 Tax=Fragilariopsis cylindrus CCMP1102 TaxID=635003 RepID=A0A1E7FUF4_9STRA|nr:hypothetical protein FRACYDRAFT_231937 [Fragilariopsis cylindrus CCMP1102]|eukprot:OEU21791.1 hypothetical protein FRACYDRAFT_231937 [Fragilariopsis cylindrus CCMP1102]
MSTLRIKFETGLIPITYHDPRLTLKLAVMTTLLEWKVTKNITKECFTKFTVTCKAFCQKKNPLVQPLKLDTSNNEATTDTGGRAIPADSDSSNSSDDDDIFDGAGGIGCSE